jgi:RNA polymerase sigma-70 factor, ECF subfamily
MPHHRRARPVAHEPSDAEIRDALARGELDDAFDLLHARYRTLIRRYARWFIGDAALAEDVVQEVLICIHRALPSIQPDTSLRAWVTAVARHRSIDELRRQGRRHRLLGDEAECNAIDEARPPGETLHMFRSTFRLARALSRVPPRTRTAVLLRYGGELSFKQIAELLDERPDTVRMRVTRALPRLRMLA